MFRANNLYRVPFNNDKKLFQIICNKEVLTSWLLPFIDVSSIPSSVDSNFDCVPWPSSKGVSFGDGRIKLVQLIPFREPGYGLAFPYDVHNRDNIAVMNMGFTPLPTNNLSILFPSCPCYGNAYLQEKIGLKNRKVTSVIHKIVKIIRCFQLKHQLLTNLNVRWPLLP